MCQVTTVLRRLLGIHEWHPDMPDHGLVRRSIHYGARGNGMLPRDDRRSSDVVIDRLEREHRIIRQMLADTARRCSRGQDVP
jgi:hypothetical protein